MRSASPSNAMPELRPGAPHRLLQILQVLGHRGIGMVVGEGAVRLAEERRDLRTQRLERGDGDDAADAVAAVGHDLHRPRQLVTGDDGLTVASEHRVVGALASLPAPPALRDDDLPESEDVVSVERVPREHHLEPVELRRVVGPGDLHAAVGLQAPRRRSTAPVSAACPRPPRCRRRRRSRDARPARVRGRRAGCRARRRARARGPYAPTRRWRRRGPAPGRTRG